jgi:quinoprotein glucose dehydrogenase
MRDGSPAERGRTFPLVMAIILALIGLWIGGFGAYLAALGGSVYYVLAGLALLATAVLLYRRKSAALAVYAALLVLTIAWALWEVGLDFWQLAPRGDLLVPLALVLLLPWLTRSLRPATSALRGSGLALSVGVLVSLAVAVAALLQNQHDQPGNLPAAAAASAPFTYAAAPGDWPAYAGTWAGLKWSPLTEINPGNAARLQVAWQFHTGDLKRPDDPGEFTYEMTPIKVGNLLYLCTPHDIVIALDPASGQQRWRFDPRVRVSGTQHMSCRGVSY